MGDVLPNKGNGSEEASENDEDAEVDDGERDDGDKVDVDGVAEQPMADDVDPPGPPAHPSWQDVVDECGNNTFMAKDGTRIGRLHQINAKSWKATCALHKKCVCWVTLKAPTQTDLDTLRGDLVLWLLAGIGIDQGAHQVSATAVKLSRGMRVRG